MSKKTLAIGLFFPILMACSGKKSNEQSQEQNKSAVEIAYDSTQAKELVGQDKLIKKLALNLKVGEIYRYKLTKNVLEKQNEMELNETKIEYFTNKVKSIRSDGSIEIAFKFDSIQASRSIKTPKESKSESYNSNIEENRKNKSNDVFNSLINEEITIIINNLGEIQDISGIPVIVNKVLGDKKDSVAPEQKSYMGQIIQMELVGAFAELFLKFPDKELDSTQTWSLKQKMPLAAFLNIDAKAEYSIASVKSYNNSKFIDVNATLGGTFAIDPKAKGKVSLEKKEFNAKGKTTINAESGMTITKNNAFKLYMEGTLPNQKFVKITETNSSYELIK